MTPDPADVIAAHVVVARDSGGGVSSSNVSAQAAVEHATPRPRTPQAAEEPTPVCWRSECRNGCYYPAVCSQKPHPQAHFDADGLPRGLMPVAGIRCGERL